MHSSPCGNYRERLIHYTNTEKEKNVMINELITQLETSQAEGQKILSDLENEQASRRRLQDDIKQLETLTRTLNAQPFILVLIDADADNYIFQERYLNHGEDGGKEAADELYERVLEYFQNLSNDSMDIKVMIRAYADIKNLQAACVRNGKMQTGAILGRFLVGFNQRQALFDFVDVGDWKEGADNKVRECLDFYAHSPQCRHIIFGGCHDQGYAPYLGKYAANASTNDRITLLKGSSIHPRIAKLGFKRVHAFDTVFAPHATKVAPSAVLTPVLPSSLALPPKPMAATTASQIDINPSPLSGRLGPVIYGDAGRRLDKVLKIKVDSFHLDVLRQNHLCHWYYLRGACDGSCKKKHVAAPLNSSAFDDLWYLARGNLCNRARSGRICDDEKCIYGHERDCQIGSGGV